MPGEDKGLVDDVGVEDAEDAGMEVIDVEVVSPDVVEGEVEEVEEVEEGEVVMVVVVREDVEEEEEEEEDAVPSPEAPFSTVKV
jgi:hypothetical protein